MLSAAYSGIFQATGLLDTARAGIARMSRRITPFGAMLCTAVAASMIAAIRRFPSCSRTNCARTCPAARHRLT